MRSERRKIAAVTNVNSRVAPLTAPAIPDGSVQSQPRTTWLRGGNRDQ
jgi:hypothetical protein